MARVTKTELNQQTARVLARVAAGEHLTVTDRGTPIAEVMPPSRTRWDRLVEAGRVRPASRGGTIPMPTAAADEPTAAILRDLRADRA